MINLLPPKEKQELLFLKNRNLAMVLGSVAVIFLVCLSLVLMSLKVYIMQKVDYEKRVLEGTQKKYETEESLQLLSSLKKYNANLSKINNFYKGAFYLSGYLIDILNVEKPKGVVFSDIILEQLREENKIKATIYGKSDSREELISFKESIDKNEQLKNVFIPPDNLIKPSEISFNLTFEIYPVK